jgi:hypothetical protein
MPKIDAFVGPAEVSVAPRSEAGELDDCCSGSLTGAYSLLDRNGRYYVPAKLKLSTFSLANTSDPFSCIVEGESITKAPLENQGLGPMGR